MWKRKTWLLVLGILLLMLSPMMGMANESEDVSGTEESSFLPEEEGVFFDEDGNVLSFDLEGDINESIYDEDGNEYIYVVEGSLIYIYDTDGNFIDVYDTNEGNYTPGTGKNNEKGKEDVVPLKAYVLNKKASLWPEKEEKGPPYVEDIGIAYVVRVLEKDGIWARVELLDGARGYMHTYYLGGRYMIRLDQHAYAMREKLTSLERFSAAAFDRKAGEHLIVLWEEGDWLYVIELEDGIGGYILKDTDFTVIEYP